MLENEDVGAVSSDSSMFRGPSLGKLPLSSPLLSPLNEAHSPQSRVLSAPPADHAAAMRFVKLL